MKDMLEKEKRERGTLEEREEEELRKEFINTFYAENTTTLAELVANCKPDTLHQKHRVFSIAPNLQDMINCSLGLKKSKAQAHLERVSGVKRAGGVLHEGVRGKTCFP